MQSSPCITNLTPTIVLASELLNNRSDACNESLNNLIQSCEKGANKNTQDISDDMQGKTDAQIDDKILCALMCCCSKHPSSGKAKTNLKQNCVDSTLQRADDMLNNQSRYKPEVSYNMTTSKPSPFMHRDALGQDTTQKSTYWQRRAKEEISGYQPGEGMVRRPDVIIVKNPALPPTQDNIERVIEMKFKGDKWSKDQKRDYQGIAGEDEKLTLIEEGGNCTCSDDNGEHALVEQPVGIPEKESSVNWGAVAETVSMAGLTVAGVAATVALVLVPIDGPFGEAAAGTATAAAATRTAAAFGRIFTPAATTATVQ